MRRRNPDARWIIGRGWNQELWPDKRFPTAADLDAVVGDRPVVLERVDGHAIVANSAAMKAAGVTAATQGSGRRPDRADGLSRRRACDRRCDRTVGTCPAADADARRDAALAKAQEICCPTASPAVARHGHAARRLGRRCGAPAKRARLNVRLMSYADGPRHCAPSTASPPPGSTAIGCGWSGSNSIADGALGSRGAWLKQPYADKPDTRGLQFHYRRRVLAHGR